MIYIQKGYMTGSMRLYKPDKKNRVPWIPDDNNKGLLHNIIGLTQTIQTKDVKRFKQYEYNYFISGELRPNGEDTYGRTKADIVYRDCAVLDFDQIGQVSMPELVKNLDGISYLVYPSPSHTEEEARYRLVIPFSSPVKEEETYKHNVKLIEAQTGYKADEASYKIAQLMGGPCDKGGGLKFLLVGGKPWNVQEPTDQDAAGHKPAHLFQLLNLGKEIHEGERDTTLFKYACALRQYNYDLEQATEMCRSINLNQFVPPLDDETVLKKIEQAWKYEPGKSLDGTDKRLAFVDTKLDSYGNPKILPTGANLKVLLEAFGISLYYDVILRRTIINFDDKDAKTINYNSPELLAIFLADISVKLGIRGFNKDRILDLLNMIARENARNIPLEKLKHAYETEYLDQDETAKLFSCFRFTSGQAENYKPFLYKWLSQVCAMLSNQNGAYGAEAVLALIGKQGIGKTQFGHKISRFFGLEYFLEGITFDDSKDSLLKGTACVIAEMGEFVAHRALVNRLKLIITANQDTERQPYGRLAETYPRYSTYYTTSNDEQFLSDDENRRFWVFPIDGIDLDRMDTVNMSRVWAEAYDRWLKLGQDSFRPTKDERRFLALVAKGYTSLTNEEQALYDRLDWDADIETWEWLSATEIAEKIGLQASNNVWTGKALRKMGYSEESEHYIAKRTANKRVYLVPPIMSTFDRSYYDK